MHMHSITWPHYSTTILAFIKLSLYQLDFFLEIFLWQCNNSRCGELFTLGHFGLQERWSDNTKTQWGMGCFRWHCSFGLQRCCMWAHCERIKWIRWGINALVAYLRVRGVWQPQTAALFDIRVVHFDAQSYAGRSVQAALKSAEMEKKGKYNQASRCWSSCFIHPLHSICWWIFG